MSKAALMGMVWSLAGQTAEDEPDVMRKIRKEWAIVKGCRITNGSIKK